MRKKSQKLTPLEIEQFDKLYQYVRSEILLYDKSQSLPSSQVLRLKGMAKGKFIENKRVDDKADYSYEIILYAFQISKPTIMSAISSKVFESENQKFNYICKIVENNLNDVYLRVKNAQKGDEKVQTLNVENLTHRSADYIQKTEEIVNEKLEELW